MKRLCAVLAVAMLTACFWGAEPEEKYVLTDNLCLYWWGGEERAELVYFESPDGCYSPVVPSVVFAAGADADFIILKRHPNRIEEIHDRLWGKWDKNGWVIADENIGDTIYFSHRNEGDSIYRTNGKWHHHIGGWTPPDSIRNPYRCVTTYHILDLRAFRENADGLREGTVAWMDTLRAQVREYTTREAFLEARKRLSVPDSLDFTIRIECME